MTGQIIEALAAAGQPMRLTALANLLGEPKARMHRHLSTLRHLGFVEQDAQTECYKLGLKLAQVGQAAMEQFDMRRLVEPFALRLRDLTGLDDDPEHSGERRCHRQRGVGISQSGDDLGQARLPPARPCVGAGADHTGLLAPDLQQRVLARKLQALTPRTLTDATILRERLALVRKQLYEVSVDETQLGISAVAAPILDFQNELVGDRGGRHHAIRARAGGAAAAPTCAAAQRRSHSSSIRRLRGTRRSEFARVHFRLNTRREIGKPNKKRKRETCSSHDGASPHGGACFSARPSAKAQDVYKIGMSAGLTGYAATVDRAWRDGVEVAIAALNAKGGICGKKIELVVEDNRSEPQEAVTVYRKMISSDKVNMFASGCVSAGNFAAAPLVVRAEKPMVLCSILPQQPDHVKWAFTRSRRRASRSRRGSNTCKKKTQVKKIGVLHDPIALREPQKTAAEKEAKDFGLEVVGIEQYKTGRRGPERRRSRR